MTIDRDLQNRAATLVAREVQCCMSSLVATLARSYGAIDRSEKDLVGLVEQAVEFSYSVLDYESAAREAGWRFEPYPAHLATKRYPGYWWRRDADGEGNDAEESEKRGFACLTADDAEAACSEVDGIDPHEREVFEHWAVSTWLAEKLEAKGEKVDRDFAGLNVWARTTTGQAIALDSVIEAIVSETGYASGGDA